MLTEMQLEQTAATAFGMAADPNPSGLIREDLCVAILPRRFWMCWLEEQTVLVLVFNQIQFYCVVKEKVRFMSLLL